MRCVEERSMSEVIIIMGKDRKRNVSKVVRRDETVWIRKHLLIGESTPETEYALVSNIINGYATVFVA